MDTKLKRSTAFIHRLTDRQRLLTEQWYFFFEATAASIPNYGMNRYPMYNMLTIEPYIPLLSVFLLRHVLGIFLRSLWT
jgi:hypothetical protein